MTERHMDKPGVHLKITLELTADFPGMTGAELIAKLDRMYGLDSLDMGDAAGALLKAYTDDRTPFIKELNGDMVFDWTGTSDEDRDTRLTEYQDEYKVALHGTRADR